MPRSREFEPNEALHKAMMLFWQKGYQETSVEDLVQTTGVSRYGLYTAFGDKHDLFLKAVNRYAHTAIQMLLTPLETQNASVPEIQTYFNHLLANADASQVPSGCLIGNTALEFTKDDASIQAYIDAHFTRLRLAFKNALQNGVSQGHLPVGFNTPRYADYLVGVVMGFLVYIRTRPTSAQLQNFVDSALVTLSETAV